MTDNTPNFVAVVLCEDIRDELGNKKSLMGVIAGDIIVAELPAVIQLALFSLYQRPNLESAQIDLTLLQDEEEIAKARVAIPAGGTYIASAIIPKSLLRFERECVFSIKAKFADGPETKIAEKKIIKGNLLGLPPT